jgi:putative hemolysin
MLRHKKEIMRKAPRLAPKDEQIDEWWGLMTANIIHLTACDVLPVHFPHKPSPILNWAEKIHSDLSDALLIREVINHRGAQIALHFGALIPYEELAPLKDSIDLTIYLRQELCKLAWSCVEH